MADEPQVQLQVYIGACWWVGVVGGHGNTVGKWYLLDIRLVVMGSVEILVSTHSF